MPDRYRYRQIQEQLAELKNAELKDKNLCKANVNSLDIAEDIEVDIDKEEDIDTTIAKTAATQEEI